MAVYQPIFSTLDYKWVGSEYFVSNWKSKGEYSTELVPLHSVAPTMKYFDRSICSQFKNSVLNVEKTTPPAEFIVYH